MFTFTNKDIKFYFHIIHNISYEMINISLWNMYELMWTFPYEMLHTSLYKTMHFLWDIFHFLMKYLIAKRNKYEIPYISLHYFTFPLKYFTFPLEILHISLRNSIVVRATLYFPRITLHFLIPHFNLEKTFHVPMKYFAFTEHTSYFLVN